jgi:hypothetical protein
MSASASAVPSPAAIDTMVRVILSQTAMTEDEIKTALVRTNYDLKRVIREYMSGVSTDAVASTATATSSANQLRFSEIRSFMDKADDQYYRRKEMERVYNEAIERKKAQAAAAQAAEAAAASTSKL